MAQGMIVSGFSIFLVPSVPDAAVPRLIIDPLDVLTGVSLPYRSARRLPVFPQDKSRQPLCRDRLNVATAISQFQFRELA